MACCRPQQPKSIEHATATGIAAARHTSGAFSATHRRRLDAYTYPSAPERLKHIAIMRVFCGTLLADLAVPDIMAKPRQSGGSAAGLDADTLPVRLEQSARWGNLLRLAAAEVSPPSVGWRSR